MSKLRNCDCGVTINMDLPFANPIFSESLPSPSETVDTYPYNVPTREQMSVLFVHAPYSINATPHNRAVAS